MRPNSLLILLGLTLSLSSYAQRQYRDDAEVRAHFGLETKFNKHWGMYLDQQYRFGDNVSHLTRGSAKLGLTYKFNKHLKVLGDYRFLQRRKNAGYYVTRHWFSGAIAAKGDIGYWRFVYRGMIQMRNGDMNTDRQHLTRWYNRHKLSIRYEVSKRVTLYTSGELYIPLNNTSYSGIDRSRHHVGALFNTFKNQQLELYFMYEPQYHKGGWFGDTDKYPDPYLRRRFVFGIGYGISI